MPPTRSQHSFWNNLVDKTAEVLLDVENWFRRVTGRKLKPATARVGSAAQPAQTLPHESTLQSVTLDEHVGLAGMAMPTLPKANKATFYGRVALVAGIVIFSFFLSLLGASQLQNSRDQQALRSDFRYSLANGTAPVSALDAKQKLLAQGTPVALISIPKLGTDAVVVEGTNSDITVHGPGHRRDTVLPGQIGVSAIYGRQYTYGGVFRDISTLQPGDAIITITGQGKSTYEVMDVRDTGDPLPTPPTETEGRLTLVSASGLPMMSTSVVRVDAKLTSKTFLTPLSNFSYSALGDSEEAMRGNPSAWPVLALSLIFLFVLVVIFILLRRFWGKWQTWIVAIPVLIAVGSSIGLQIATLFPNLI